MNKRVLMSALLLALGAGGGYWAAKQSTDGATVKEKTPLYWVNPMDPRDKRDGPAKDNMGMDFIPVYEEQKNGSPGTVTISPEIQQNLGVRLAKVEKLPIHQEIETVGYVGYDEDRLEAINARMAGWIRTLAIKSEGQKVAKGTLLYEIYAPDLVNAQHEYLLALNTSDPRRCAPPKASSNPCRYRRIKSPPSNAAVRCAKPLASMPPAAAMSRS